MPCMLACATGGRSIKVWFFLGLQLKFRQLAFLEEKPRQGFFVFLPSLIGLTAHLFPALAQFISEILIGLFRKISAQALLRTLESRPCRANPSPRMPWSHLGSPLCSNSPIKAANRVCRASSTKRAKNCSGFFGLHQGAQLRWRDRRAGVLGARLIALEIRRSSIKAIGLGRVGPSLWSALSLACLRRSADCRRYLGHAIERGTRFGLGCDFVVSHGRACWLVPRRRPACTGGLGRTALPCVAFSTCATRRRSWTVTLGMAGCSAPFLDSDEATVVKGLADELQHLVVVHLGKGKAVQTKVADEVACLHQVVAIQTSQHPKRPVRVYLVVPALGRALFATRTTR